jgi:hypothetical protein
MTTFETDGFLSAEILEFARTIAGRYAKKLELAADTNRLAHRVIYSIKPHSEHAPDLILAALLTRQASAFQSIVILLRNGLERVFLYGNQKQQNHVKSRRRPPGPSQVLALLCTFATGFSLATAIDGSAELFDPTHRVVLSGPEGQSVADACGGKSSPTSWAPKSDDIDRLERTLAPLLAADLQNSGSTSLPRQYYRQYATGRLGSRRAIFVNGFHESYISFAAHEVNWRRSAVTVLDGGDSYWCAIYIEDTRDFVKFKGHHFDTHVWFHGLA